MLGGRLGAGRTGGERIWRADGLNRAADPNNLIFVFTDNQGNWDNPPADSSGGCIGRVCVSPAVPIPSNTVTITYTLGPDAYPRKTVQLTLQEGQSIDRLEVERFSVDVPARRGGRGEPVFVGDAWWFGVECVE